MEYNHIEKFLDRFKKIIFKKEEENNVVFEIIKKHIGFPIEKNAIKIKNTSIFIKGSPIFRSEVLIHKQNILLDLKKSFPNRLFTDIK